MKLKAVMLILALLVFSISVSAQEVSEKSEIAVFRLGYAQWKIPRSVLANIDEEIKGVFINIGRFIVIGMNQRLEEGDLTDFVDKIKQFKSENVEIPEKVQMGKEFFTEADLNRLIGSFIVVIPSVSNYILERLDSGEYEVTLKSCFTFYNVQEGTTFAQNYIETEGKDENAEKAIKEAVDAIAMQLTFEIRKITEFQLKTGILEVHGSEVIIELGRDLGIKVGDEFLIVSTRVLNSGKTYTSENGLIIIKEVSDEVSVGKIIYARPRPNIGDQLREIPRLGLDTTPYLHVALGALANRDVTVLFGLRQSISRGFYDFRPFAGIEVPLITNIVAAIPVNLYIGGEYNLYLGRLQITPMASVGIGGAYLWYLDRIADVTEEEKFFFTHVGGAAGATVSYLFNKNIKFVLDGGYMYWFSLIPLKVFTDSELVFQNYDGLYLGCGITIKY